MFRITSTLMTAALIWLSLDTLVHAQARGVRGTPAERPIEYRTREKMISDTARPSGLRSIKANPVQEARNSQRDFQPTSPPEEDGPLLQVGPVLEGQGPLHRIREYSRIYLEAPLPKEIKQHDIVTIIVDEKSEVIMNQKFNRQKNATLKADLKEFVRFGETGNLLNAANNNPKIDAQLTGNLNTTGLLTDQEGIKYRIAAKVTDVKPNGTILLEARKIIHTQDDLSEYTLNGEVRAVDINPDNTASSENIANLQIVKRQKGRVSDSVKRHWGIRILDWLSPF